MMWRLKHRLFGWHYVYMTTSGYPLRMKRRIRVTPAGDRYVLDYVGTGMIFLDRDDQETRRWTIVPLTWGAGEVDEGNPYQPKFRVVA